MYLFGDNVSLNNDLCLRINFFSNSVFCSMRSFSSKSGLTSTQSGSSSSSPLDLPFGEVLTMAVTPAFLYHFTAKWLGSSGVATIVTTSPKGKSDGEEDDDPDCVDVGPDGDENALIEQKTSFEKKFILKHRSLFSETLSPIGTIEPQQLP